MAVSADTALLFAGPAVLAERVRAREVHPRELVELALRRIDELDPKLNAFRVTMAEEALAAAEGPLPDGPLTGVPFAIKDDVMVAGQIATQGSRSFGAPATHDAEIIRRLRGAGAIPVGITNVPELFIFPWTATAANGITRNPWDTSRTPGGSSGGSAAAVAAGLVAFATGGDGGGSIRIPAAACGLVGMKPSRGRVTTAPLAEHWLGLSVSGALARTVADSALLLDVLHGTVPGEREFVPRYAGSYAQAAATPPGKLRIAMSRKSPPGLITKLSSDQRSAWEGMGERLRGLGHEVSERDPDYGLAQLDFLRMWVRGIYEEARLVPERGMLESTTRQMAAAGRLISPRRRDKLLAKRERTSQRIMGLWDSVDVLVTPGLAKTAIAAEGGFGKPAPLAIDIAGRATPFTPMFNLTGQPAMTIPAGIGADGLPLSVQLVGRRGAEDVLYSLAGQLEQAAPWADRRPPGF